MLTDEKYFQGKFEYLQTVTSTVTCPVLNKDFFVDTYQVHLARYYGADAILLMLSVLNDEEYQALADVAQAYNMAILTEVSNEEETARAIALGAKLIGINNRNLRDLSTDISRTLDIAPTIPEDRIIISESGIYTNDQVREIAPSVDGFLVGSSLMAEDDLDLACRQLIFGQNKVCGITAAQQTQLLIEAGAVYAGLIFAEKSPRCVDLDTAQKIVQSCSSLRYVGVFVDHDENTVIEYAKTLGLSAVQLHGQESDSYIASLKAQLPAHVEIWQAVSVQDEVPPLNTDCAHYVLDGKAPGSGQPFRWQTLAESEQILSRCFLAGGLSASNIKQAINLLNEQELFGLDINSGVETSPGQKTKHY